jgi:cysteine desulfurase
MKKIYFDHAATTPVDPEVLSAMMPYFSKKFGNAASLHSFGQEALQAYDQAREKVADFLGAKPKEIIFTSGATESNNLAIRGLAKVMKGRGGQHIITSRIEHPAVLEVCQALEKEGFKVTYLKVDKDGLIFLSELEKAITDQTFMVSIMYVNNETGAIQPIKEIGEKIEGLNKGRKNKIYFHVDAVQAVNYLNCKADYLKADFISLSAHKIYGPKGIGALYKKENVPLFPIQFGGHHEFGLRSGTQNVPGAVGLAKALELVEKRKVASNNKLNKLGDRLINGVLKILDSKLNGNRNKKIPSHNSFTLKNVEGEAVLTMLDLEGMAISTGSACASGSLEPSHVLLAMGLSEVDCHGSIRVTLGKDNTEKEVLLFLEKLPLIIKKLRRISPYKK